MIWTIGHGNRTIAEFLALLREAGMTCLVDVRAYPESRRHPHFARAALEESLAGAQIRYVWEGRALGGRRRSAADSPHVALKDPQFRAYADHMMTAEFQEGLGRLIAAGGIERTAIMCAERLPSECHRNLVSDALAARGVAVQHILTPGANQPHVLSVGVRLAGDVLIYDAGEQLRLRI